MKTFQVLFTAVLIAMFTFASAGMQAEITYNPPSVLLDECPPTSFSIVNNGVLAGTPVSFSNQSTGATSYLWDFGDGGSSNAVHPSHTYSSAGAYTVKLYATFGECTVEFIITEDVIIF